MATEEQQEELEVLQSIYPDELTQIDETSFRISIVLDPPHNITYSSDEPPVAPTLSLVVAYTPDYPATAPNLDLHLVDPGNLDQPLEFPEDKDLLLKSLDETIEENLGMAMVFTLASTLKDTAETLLSDRAEAVEKEREEKLRQEEEKEMEKFRGELVTKERFLKWRENWLRERREEEERRVKELEAAEAAKKGGVKEKKLTGKEMWERGLAGEVEGEGVEGDVEEVVEGVAGVKV